MSDGPSFEEFRGRWDRRLLPDNVILPEDSLVEGAHSFERYRSQLPIGLRLGHRVHVYTWTTFNVEPQGYIEVGDDSVLVGAVFMCADRIVIGQQVVISYHVTIADSDFHPLDADARRRDAIASAPGAGGSARPIIQTRPVTIGNRAWIGIGALILKGVTIGSDARIGPGAVVTKDVPPGTSWEGNPAVQVGRR